ncbi:MAG: hypothetical protein ACRCXD_13095 [Luteolibacter sp.]
MSVACAPSTPQTRIQKYPEKFATLGKQEQALVEQGQISPGMSADAVVIAWGFPDRRFEGSSNSKTTERWDYTTVVPVHSPTFVSGAYGFGCGRYGPHGRWGHHGGGFGFGPEITYLPQRVASVWFIDRRVDSWERLR